MKPQGRSGLFLPVAAALCLTALLLFPQAPGAEGGAGLGPYSVTPEPMTVAECGRCHPFQFAALRDSGGKHRFACLDCHEIFHAYNPRKDNFDQLMPSCSVCHDLPHGSGQADCLTCHQNPHAPRKISAERLGGQCGSCHDRAAGELRDFPSAHSTQGCETCHYEEHGHRPSCAECHESHLSGQAPALCQECHQPHKPLDISLPADTESGNCSGCHEEAYRKWEETESRHGDVHCAVCHSRHGMKPQCTDCHEPPHDPRMMAKFSGCLGCHLDAHDLPTR